MLRTAPAKGPLSFRRCSFALALLVCLWPALACGVALPPAAITATALSGESETTSDGGATLTSSLAPNPVAIEGHAASLLAAPSPTPLATVSGTLRTVTPANDVREATPPATPPATTATASVMAGALAPAGALGPTATPAPAAGSDPSEVIDLVNSVRTGAGLRSLSVNATLARAAASYAQLMAEKDSFGHTGPDGSTPESRIAASGYSGQFEGEAIAAGQPTAQDVVNSWLTSPPHKAILLSPNAAEIGVGHYYEPGDVYGNYWVLVVGAP